jgi:hypothetical protein
LPIVSVNFEAKRNFFAAHEVPAALQHTWSGHAKSHASEVYKKLLKQRELRLRWAEKTGTGFTLPGHQQAATEASNGKPGKLLQFRKVG